MEEEIRKKLYRNLLNNTTLIYNEINSLNNDLNSLKETLEDNFIIDNNIICQKELLEIIAETKKITNELRYTVISNIKYKSY